MSSITFNISDFLPKYPNIHDTKYKVLNPYKDKKFQDVLYRKKEFYDNRLSRSEEFPSRKGQLFKHQNIIAKFLSGHTPYDELLIAHEMGCVSPETPILKWDGSICRADDIVVGDILVGDDGYERKVTRLISGRSEMYQIDQTNACTYTVNKNHILTLYITKNFNIEWGDANQGWILEWFDKESMSFLIKTSPVNNETSKDEAYDKLIEFRNIVYYNDDTIDISIEEYLEMDPEDRKRLVGYQCSGVYWPYKQVDIDPYILGLWLGCDDSTHQGFKLVDEETISCLSKWSNNNGYYISPDRQEEDVYHVYNQNQNQSNNEKSQFVKYLKNYGLTSRRRIISKHIPHQYLVNDITTRLQLLAGIIDSCGIVSEDRTSVKILYKSYHLASDVCKLVRSLGLYCSQDIEVQVSVNDNRKRKIRYQSLSISGIDLDYIPVNVYEKRLCGSVTSQSKLESDIAITSVGYGPYVGWELEGSVNKRFLLGDCTVTHNTGKSCSAIGAIEQIKSEGLIKCKDRTAHDDNLFRGALIIAPGRGLLDNFVQEIALKCTDGKYIPEDFNDVRSESKRMRLLRQSVKKECYRFATYQTLAKHIKSLIINGIDSTDPDYTKKTYRNIIDRYSNMIFVFDEVHHLRPKLKMNKSEQETYEMMKILCQVTHNRKIILMSGTPIRDRPEEVASIMNLILPLNKQLPLGKDFVKEYLYMTDDETYIVNQNKIDKLKEYFAGRVSVLKSMESEVKKEFVGRKVGDLRHFKVEIDSMSELQTQAYQEAYKKDTQKAGEDQIRQEGFYSSSRQAILMAIPSEKNSNKLIYGSELFKEGIKVSKTQTLEDALTNKRKTVYSYSLTPYLRKLLKGRDTEETIKNISKYSSKYANIIRHLLANRNKNTYIYSEFVGGSGSILFSKLLDLVGYTKATGKETSHGLRYAILTSQTATPARLNDLKARFNRPDNMNGDYIQVIIGSPLTIEGFSFMNVQEEHIVTPQWNYTYISQALARGLRAGSHRVLIENGIQPIVRMYQHASIPSDKKYPSIDMIMYEKSEKKDVSIQRIERIMKESAMDCPLVYNRNYNSNAKDGSRECNYQECLYTCDDVPQEEIQNGIPDANMDLSTYQLYYSSSDIKNIVEDLEKLFATKFYLSLGMIMETFSHYPKFVIISALNSIINETRVIYNKYGFPCYLQEQNNIYFLVTSLTDDYSILSSYYTEKPIIQAGCKYEKCLEDIYSKSIPQIISALCNVSYEEFIILIRRLPKQVQEMYIEGAIIANNKDIDKNTRLQTHILEYFKTDLKKINGMWVSTLLQPEGPARCLNTKGWTDCPSDIFETIQKSGEETIDSIINNDYGYYGLYDKEKPDYFAIVDTTKVDASKLTDKRKIPTGQNCSTMKKKDLAKTVHVLKLPYDTKLDLSWEDMLKTTAFKKAIGDYENTIKDMNTEDQNRIYYWVKKPVKEICAAIREKLDSENLTTVKPKKGGKKKVDKE